MGVLAGLPVRALRPAAAPPRGDATRTLVDSSRPVHARTRVRVIARHVALSPSFGSPSRCTACSSRPWDGGPRDRGTVPRGCARALRGGHRHRGPLPAADGLEDVLRLLDRLRGRRTQHPRLPGLPRPPGHAAGDQPAGGRVRDRDGPRDRGADPRAHPVGAQELLLPGPAQGLPDQPVRDPARQPGAALIQTSAGPFTVPITRAHLEEDTAKLVHGDAGAEVPGRRRALARGLQPVGGAPDGDRHRAGHPDGRAGAALCRGAPAPAAVDRRERRRPRARTDAHRGERLAAASWRPSRSGRGSRSRT